MQPMGRKKNRMPQCKHKVKILGKHVAAWWEDIIPPSKKRERQNAKREINNQD